MSFLDKLQEGLSGVGEAVKGAAGNVWDAIQPAEAQAISPEEILKYNIKQAFNTSGRVLTPELTGQISQVAMPLLRKTPSYHQQRAQGSLFNSLLKTPNPETYNPEFISGHVKGMSRVPDWMFKSFPTDVSYKDPASFSEGTFGTYFHNPRNAAADVGINPAFPYAIPTAKRLAISLAEADKVIPHELNHVAAYASKDAIKNSPIADAWDDIATVRGTGKILDNLNTKSKYYFNNFTNENITPYDIQPRELAAKYFASHLADGEKDIPGLFKASMKFATNAIKDAYPSISKLGEEQGDKIRGLALPLLLAGGVGAGGIAYDESQDTKADAGLIGKFSGTPKLKDAELISQVENYLTGKGNFPGNPKELYRGIPKGAIPEAEDSSKYIHATPWAKVAETGGKGAFGSSSNDIYNYDVLPSTKYYRGGSLAGDPLETTTINSSKGISWEDAVSKTKEYYDKNISKGIDTLLSQGIKGKELEEYLPELEKGILSDAILNLKKGTFETDAFAKSGIWENSTLPASLNKTKPFLRSNDELQKIVDDKIAAGINPEDTPEYKILSASGNLKAMSNFDRAEEAKNFFNPAGKTLGEVVPLKGIGDVAAEGGYQAVTPIREGIPFGDAAKKAEEERNAFLGNSKIDVKGAFDVSNERDQFTKDVVERVKNPIKAFEEQGGGIEKTLPAFLSTDGTTDYSSKFKKGLDVLSNVIGGVGRYGETQVNTLDDIRKRVIGGKGELGDIGKGAEAVTNLAEFTPGPVGLMAMGLNKLFNDKGLARPEDYGDVSDPKFKSPHGFREDSNTYKDRTVLENVLLGGLTAGLGALALKSPLLQNEAGAINMPGFFSKLTTAIDTMKAGKVPLSTKMTGKGLEQALKAGGISADELKFTGLGKELARIGDRTLGAAQLEDLSKRGEVFGKVDMKEMGSAKMKELARQAEENALPFSKEVTPGIHSQYSLFKAGDPSFKNSVYKYPGTNFEEDHFGKDVVAHSRGGDKEVLYKDPANKEFITSINSKFIDNGNLTSEQIQDAKRFNELTHSGDLEIPEIKKEFEALGEKYLGKKKLKSYHVDELQSQFHQRGATFGYGELKRPSEFNPNFSAIKRHLDTASGSGRNKLAKDLFDKRDLEYRTKYPDTYKAVTAYNNLREEWQNLSTGTAKEFADYIVKDKELYDKLKSYTTNVKPVGDVPLQKDKWIELLAKDHLQEALKNGKDSISLTPAEEQFKRYYKDKAVEGSWEFNKDTKRLVITDKFGRTDEYQNAHDFGLLGKETSKKIIGELSAGKIAGVIEPEKNLDIYKGTYSEYERKMEGLTGGKFQDGWTKDSQGKDVKVRVLKLDEAKKKFVEDSKVISLEDIRKELSPVSSLVQTNGNDIAPIKEYLNKAVKEASSAITDFTMNAESISRGMKEESRYKVRDILKFNSDSGFVEDNITDTPSQIKILDNILTKDQSLTKDERMYLMYNKNILEQSVLGKQLRNDIIKLNDVGKTQNKVKPFPIAKAQEAIDFFNPTKQALV